MMSSVLDRITGSEGTEDMRRLFSLAGEKQKGLDDEAALRAAYSAHSGELFGFARNHLHDVGLAEEAVQETFLRAWRAAEKYDPSVGSLRTWLFSICRNVVIDLARRRSVRPFNASAAEQEREIALDDDAFETSLTTFQLEEALRRLSDDHRYVLVETYYKARPVAEVAAELGVPDGTVRSRQFYALRALRLAMEEMGWSDD
jgi:RNA polymerase sigma-70 factor (ECF subfamily)